MDAEFVEGGWHTLDEINRVATLVGIDPSRVKAVMHLLTLGSCDVPRKKTTRTKIEHAHGESPYSEQAQEAQRDFHTVKHEDIRTVHPKLDAKFYAAVHKVKDGTSVPDDQWMIFLAKDNAFPPTLQFYLEECERLGADQEHLDSVRRTIKRVKDWRDSHPEALKIPDAKGEKLIG